MSNLQNIQITFKNTPTLRHDTVSLSDPHLMPVYIVSGVSAGIFIIAPFLVRRGPNQGIIRWCIALTIVSCWLLWVSIYLGQMNPLIGPRMSNASLAWVGYCWGSDPKKLEEGGGAAGEDKETGGDTPEPPPSEDSPEPPPPPPPPPPEEGEGEGGRRQALPKSLPTIGTY